VRFYQTYLFVVLINYSAFLLRCWLENFVFLPLPIPVRLLFLVLKKNSIPVFAVSVSPLWSDAVGGLTARLGHFWLLQLFFGEYCYAQYVVKEIRTENFLFFFLH
jgi:hypothetical protein